MKKEELLTKLNRSIEIEEQAVPIYLRHLNTALDWSGLREKEVDKIKDHLKILSEDAKQHKKLFDDIKKRISSGGKDVY